VAFVLEDDSAYADHRGRQHYLNQILNENSVRQWSLPELAARGFDRKTGIWFESPGYSMNVVADFIGLINRIDLNAGTDLLEQIPVVRQAAVAMAQYAFPNGTTVSWGDSHYGPISSAAARQMVKNAQMHHRQEDAVYFMRLAKLFDQLNSSDGNAATAHAEQTQKQGGLDALFDREQMVLDPMLTPLKAEEVLQATFSAPSVSYLVQRNGLDPQNGLMISEAGSLGNHQHANGITIELYGYGLPLAPDSGIGTNYFESDHNEYYAQFPAHNTVIVDGISSYPTMLSHHGFEVNALYPAAGNMDGIESPMTMGDVSFLEPETSADQRRVTATIRTAPDQAYYVDIFRSHRRDGRDRMQDYFFHALGQSLQITDSKGATLALEPTTRLTFAEQSLGAYDYLWDKQTVAPSPWYHATYTLALPQQSKIRLHAWMQGAEGRELFSVMAPAARSLRDTVPTEIGVLPLHTLVMRQSGEAWKRPFVAVFEPARADRSSLIRGVRTLALKNGPESAVAIQVSEGMTRQQTILNSVNERDVLAADGLSCQCSYAVLDEGGGPLRLLMTGGEWIAADAVSLRFDGGPGSAYIERDGVHLILELSRAGELELPLEKDMTALHIGGKQIAGRKIVREGHAWMSFSLSATGRSLAEMMR
jgi:hypothetical protein